MRFKFERFPVMTCREESFRVALKNIKFSSVFNHLELLKAPVVSSLWDIKVSLAANVYPQDKLHPLFQFLLDNQFTASRGSTYIHLPDSMEVMLGPGEFLTQHLKQRAVFTVEGHLTECPSVIDIMDYEQAGEFFISTYIQDGVSITEFTAQKFYVPEDL